MSRVFILSIIAAALGAYLASKQGRNWLLWGLICFIFSPALLLLAFLPPVQKREVEVRRCPACGMPNRPGDPACRNCKKPMPIEMVKCPSCEKYVPEGTRCPECGSRL